MTDSPAWPQSLPFFRLMALVLSLCALFWFVKLWQKHAPFVERHDLGAYVHASLPPVPFWKTYSLLVRAEVGVDGIMAVPSDSGIFRFETGKWNHDLLRAWLRANVYGGQPVWIVLRWPLAGFGCVLIVLMILGAKLDRSINREAREGLVLRGRRIVSKWKWNRSAGKGPGLSVQGLKIAEDLITQHFQIVGATGTGKSTVLRHLAYQLLQRGPGVFVDLACEYVQEFYQPGDWVLNFFDDRCPRWPIGRDAIDEPHAIAIGEGAYPHEPGDQFFFMDHARAILAFLLGRYHPTTTELAFWIAHPIQLDIRIKGTEHAETLTRNSPEQRAGIIGTMARLARSLRWMPDEEGRREFTVTEWAQTRKGSIFLTSAPDTFPALFRMQSLILDLILLKMQTTPGPGFILADEVGQLQRLPQLERAMSMQRKAGNPILLGYQGFSQLEMHYGDKAAESIVSAPATSVVLRTEGEKSAKWSSSIIGMPSEMERVRESRSIGNLFFRQPHRTLQSERPTISPVLPSEVQSLPKFHGYIASEGQIAAMRTKPLPVVFRAPRLIERIIPPTVAAPDQPPPQRGYVRRNTGNQKVTTIT